jgi:hypothetical protein
VELQGGAGSDDLVLVGNAGDDAVTLEEGVARLAGVDNGDVPHTGLERIRVDGAAGGADTLTVLGTDADESFSLTAQRRSATGTLQLTGRPTMRFEALGTAEGAGLKLTGNGGADAFRLTHATNWTIPSVTVSAAGGDADLTRLTATNGPDRLRFTPSGKRAGDLTAFSPADGDASTRYALEGVEALELDGADGADALLAEAPRVTLDPAGPRAGTLEAQTADGDQLLGLTYESIDTPAAASAVDRLRVLGTSAADQAVLRATGTLALTDGAGRTQEIDASAADRLWVQLQGGDDVAEYRLGNLLPDAISGSDLGAE